MNIKIIDWIKSAIYKADNAQATVDALAAKVAELHPVGSVIAFAANSAPSGCLLCNGAAVSRTTYADLFAAIGTTYGSGDGSTTFNLPNLTDKFIQGSSTAGMVKAAGVPNLHGYFSLVNSEVFFNQSGAYADGVFYKSSNIVDNAGNFQVVSHGEGISSLDFDAYRYNSIYGNSNTVQPPAVTMRYYIKY